MRSPEPSARTAPRGLRPCIVMTCDDAGEAEQIGRLLSEQGGSSLVMYRRAEDLVLNGPRQAVGLVILAGADGPPVVMRTLQWLKRRWPHCPTTVVGDPGNREMELAARSGGASYLARPVSGQEWFATLDHAVRRMGGQMARQANGGPNERAATQPY